VGTEEGLRFDCGFLGDRGRCYCNASTTLAWNVLEDPLKNSGATDCCTQQPFKRVLDIIRIKILNSKSEIKWESSWRLDPNVWNGLDIGVHWLAQSNELIVPGQNIAFSINRRLIRISAPAKWGVYFGPWTSWGFWSLFWINFKENSRSIRITRRMIMNLFGYEKSVFNSDKFFTHLKSSSY